MSIAGDSQPIGEGSVVYFHDLHLDTARRVSRHPFLEMCTAMKSWGNPGR